MQKSIARNSMYNILYKMINIGYPLITTAYTSRILMPEGMGKISLSSVLVSYFTTIAALGIPNYGIKLVGMKQDDYNERSEAFSELFIINMFSSLLSFICFLFLLPLFSLKADRTLLLIFSSQILFNIINIDWFYQGIEEYAYIAIRNTLIKFISLVLMFIFVRSSNDYISYAVILCCATFGNYIFNIIHVKKYISFTIKIKQAIRKHMGSILILFASVCASEVYTMLDSTMIGVFCTETELGYYSNSIKLIRVVFSFVSAMCMVYFPRISYLYNNAKKEEFYKITDQVLELAMFFSIPASAGIFCLSMEIVQVLFGNEFLSASLTIQVLAPLIVIFSLAYVGGHMILISVNREKDIMVVTLAATLCNIFLNCFFIKTIGYNGAGIATVLTETIVTISLCIRAHKFLRRSISLRFIFSTFAATLLMVTAILFIKQYRMSSVLTLVISILIGSLIYGSITLLFRNDVALRIVTYIKGFFVKKLKKRK